MWDWIRQQGFRVWAGFGVAATCLGVWADRESVPVALLTWLIPYLALGGAVFVGGLLLTKFVLLIHDLKTGGPSIRAFNALAPWVEECKKMVEVYYGLDDSATDGQRIGVTNLANVEIMMLFDELRDLGIQVPNFRDVSDRESAHHLLLYLGTMEGLARRSALRRAKGYNERVYRELQDG